MNLENEISLYNGINIEHKFGIPETIHNYSGLNIIYLNSRSIKYDNLNDVEFLLQRFDKIIHLVVINETWLDVNSFESCNLINYNSYHNFRTNKSGGGVSIFCHKSINSNLVFNDYFLVNSHFLMINLIDLKINIATIYRTPDSNYLDFLEYFSEKLNKIKNVIFIGDFNINMLNSEAANANAFKNLVESEGFVLLNHLSNDMATRVTEHSSTIIDLAITDLGKYNYKMVIDDVDFSDHRVLLLNVNLSSNIETNKTTRKKINYNKVRSEIENNMANMTESWETFHQAIMSIIERNKTVITEGDKNSSYKQPWCSKSIQVKLMHRKTFYDLHKKDPHNQYHKQKYAELKSSIEKLVVEAKQTYYSNEMEKTLNNPRHTWGVMNKMIYNREPRTSCTPKQLIVKDAVFDSPQDISEELNHYFSTIGTELANECERRTELNFEESESISNVYKFEPVSLEEVDKIISNLNSSAASGYDSVSVNIIKNSKAEITSIVTSLINKSFETGIFPDELKIAKVIPIFKGGDKSDPGNYRPVSVLSILSKIIEIAIKTRMIKHLEYIKFLHPSQYGFQKASSTVSACLSFTETVLSFINENKKTGSTFIDIKKAFDSVDHRLLLLKLKNIGFKDKALKIIESFLTNRYQYVSLDDIKSSKQQVKTGVPQGSILGPTLFIVFINDIFELKTRGKLQLYADDAGITYGENSYEQLQHHMTEDLVKIKEWMDRNKLTVNFKKTEFMIYYLRNSNIDKIFNEICIENVKIDRVLEYKYLGLIINHNLNWVSHINNTKQRIARFVGVFRKISNCLTEKFRKQLYFAFVHSYLTCLNPIWASGPNFKMNELQVIQNKAMKSLYQLPRLTPTVSLYKDNILPVALLSQYELCLLVFKIKNNLIKFDNNFVMNSSIHSYSTRIVNNLRSIFSRNNVTANSIFHKGINVYNSLPENIKKEVKLSSFKMQLKKYLSFVNNN